jgi:hypothetical protein
MLYGTYLFIDDPWHIVFPLLKFFLYLLLLFLFYVLFIRSRKIRNSNSRDREKNIRVHLKKNRNLSPGLLNLVIKNNSNSGVEVEAPVVIFRRWNKERKFRILSVEFKEMYPVYIGIDQATILNINLQQFFDFAPELKKTGRVSVEIKLINGPIFKSGNIRLKW